jgi:predicted RNA-binding Zn-ribbon protein involved in translation (DUF1610 family)
MDKKCPGTELRNLKVEIIKCSNCGYEIEIFSDEVKVRCPKCKTEVFRENIPSCVSWCIYAKECIGEEKYNQIKNFIIEKQQKMDVREKVLLEMMNYFKDDLKRIEHARKVLMYAERILEDNPQADRNDVTPISLKQKNGHSCFCTKMTLLCCDYKFRIPISLLKFSKCKLLSILSFHFWYLLKNISNDGGNFLCIFYSIFQKVYPDSWRIIYRKYVQLSPPP